MCGIVGIIAKNVTGLNMKDETIFKEMLYADALRGHDSTGAYGITKDGNISIVKTATTALPALETTKFKSFFSEIYKAFHIVIGHNRKTTQGKTIHENAHPFWDKNNKIVLVHNGTISNKREFCTESDVDSAAICNALADKPIEDVISTIDGAFALVWYDVDKEKLFLIRNDRRPLYVLETATSLIICSEAELGTWISHRNNNTVIKYGLVPEMVLHSIDLKTKKFTRVMEIKKKSVTQIYPQTIVVNNYKPTVNTTTHGHGDINSDDVYDHDDQPPDTLYLTENDLEGNHIVNLIRCHDVIGMIPITYKEPTESQSYYKIESRLLNIKNKNIKVVSYVNKDEFNDLDLTGVLITTVSSVLDDLKEREVTIYTKGKIECETLITTKDDYEFTESMYYGIAFESHCTCCKNQITFDDLKEAWIEFEDSHTKLIICKECCEKRH